MSKKTIDYFGISYLQDIIKTGESGTKKGGKIGLFQQAHMGTIFLDEIGEMTYTL